MAYSPKQLITDLIGLIETAGFNVVTSYSPYEQDANTVMIDGPLDPTNFEEFALKRKEWLIILALLVTDEKKLPIIETQKILVDLLSGWNCSVSIVKHCDCMIIDDITTVQNTNITIGKRFEGRLNYTFMFSDDS